MVKRLCLSVIAVTFLVSAISAPVNAASSNKIKTSKSGIYASLGDSVAAGAGLAPLQFTQGTAKSPCAQSSEAYPYLVAQKTKLRPIYAACSGATAQNLVTKQGNAPAQLDIAFSQGTPELMTITAGANDARWAQIVYSCYSSDCATTSNEALAKTSIATANTRLKTAFSEIQRRSNGTPPQVIVTGYYNPISNKCINKQSYATSTEIKFLNKQRDALNASIRDAIKPYKFITYASSNFDQHGLCGKQPWSQGIADNAPLHPNALGQKEIARSVLSAARR